MEPGSSRRCLEEEGCPGRSAADGAKHNSSNNNVIINSSSNNNISIYYSVRVWTYFINVYTISFVLQYVIAYCVTI